MNNSKYLLIFVGLILFSCNEGDHSIKHRINTLRVYLDKYPPKVGNNKDLEMVFSLYSNIISELEKDISTDHNNSELHEILGEVYRMGHNLDIDSAWEKSELHLIRAIFLNPNSSSAYLSLGTLYVNTNVSYAAKAEYILLKCLTLSQNKQSEYVYQSLGFAYYYQGKFSNALNAFEMYLKHRPDDLQTKKIYSLLKESQINAPQNAIIN